MDDTPFDNAEVQEAEIDNGQIIDNLVKKSKLKIKKEEGYFIGAHGYKNSILNVKKLIEEDSNLNKLWRWNELLGDIDYAKTPPWNPRIKEGKMIEDGDIIFLTGWLASKYHFEPPDKTIRNGLFLHAQQRYYHPIKDYLESLEWDKVPRLDEWISKTLYLENNSYYKAVGRKIICSMVHRIYVPGCQMDYMPIFEGKEGIFKTTMLKILGDKWYAPFTGITHTNFEKDAVDIMRGKWLLELAELTAVRRIEDFDRVKAFISCTEDRVRLSYRRDAHDFKRQCVLVGTMNPKGNNEYFRDPGENRRFWPLECPDNININWLKKNRDNLFAEAMECWESEKLFLDNKEALEISINKQEERRPEDSWVETIEDYLQGKNVITPNEVMTKCLHCEINKISHSNLSRVGICMRRLGWLPKQMGLKKKKYYIRPDTDINDINEGIRDIFGDEEE